MLDIGGAKSKMLSNDFGEPRALVAKLTSGPDRGPLEKGWTSKTDPVMTCYKQITVHCKWGFLTNKLESVIMNKYREILLAFHQKIWLWIEQWNHLTMEDIRRLENETKEELLQRIKDAEQYLGFLAQTY